ncbi:hypothetical protein D3C72_1007850 [compost metagenome]
MSQFRLALHVQVVAGLVQQQQVVAGQRQAQKQQTRPLAAAQGRHRLAMARIGKACRDQGLLARHLAARGLVLHGKRIQGVGQVGVVGQLLERLVVVTDVGGVVVAQVTALLLCLYRLPAQP